MQPAAAEVERKARCIDGPGTAAQPVARFDHQAIDARRAQPPAGRDAGRAAADDRNFGFIVLIAANVLAEAVITMTMLNGRLSVTMPSALD